MVSLSLALALLAQCSLVRLAPRAHVVHDPSQLSDEYDYVVIGGGTSGLTVANRLTEDPNGTVHILVMPRTFDVDKSTVTVLVIEYGYLYDLHDRSQL